MANKKLFSTKGKSVKSVKPANTVNNAGGVAYSLSDKAALAQLAMTGCFNGTFYVSAKNQLEQVLELANKLPVEYVAKLAVYSRQQGLMKDMPAVLAAVVASKDSDLLTKIFPQVIDNPKMVRNFVQVLRSGATGRKSLGTRPKKLVQEYLDSLTDEQLFKADVGNDPSLPDIIKMIHPRPATKKRSALYGYLLGKEYSKRDLCKLVKEFEAFKADMSNDIPNVPFQMLTALPLTDVHWKSIAQNATWTQTRMNLNTFARHNVLKDNTLVSALAERLSDVEQVKKAKAFPYQLFSAFLNVDSDVPPKLSVALQKAADASLDNIPSFENVNGNIYIFVDTSGSMQSPATGYNGSATSKMRCVDVAALMASSVMRKNENVVLIPFDNNVHKHNLNPMDSIMTNAQKLAKYGGGGTSCSEPMRFVNSQNGKGDLVIYVSDNESWMDKNNTWRGTQTMEEWTKFKKRNPNAKLVCIDITPNVHTQAYDRDDILNVGGFSDQVFDVIGKFIELGNNKDLWVKTIESVKL